MKRALLIAGGAVGGLGAVLSITPPHLGVAASSVNSLASGTSTQTSTPDAPQAVTTSQTPVSSPASSSSASTVSTPTASVTTSKNTATPVKTTVKSVASKKATSKSSNAQTAPKNTNSTPSSSASATQSTAPATQPATQTPTPTPTKTTATPTPVASGVSGTFTGGTYDASENGRLWGRVTVTVTLKDGEISNVSATQNPSSHSYNAFSYLNPAVLTQKLSVKTVMSITPASLVSQIRGYTGASYSSFAYWQSLQSALSKAGL